MTGNDSSDDSAQSSIYIYINFWLGNTLIRVCYYASFRKELKMKELWNAALHTEIYKEINGARQPFYIYFLL